MYKRLSLALLVIFAGCASSFFLKLQQDSLDNLQYPKKSFFETILTHQPQKVPDDLKNLKYPDDHLIQSIVSQAISALSTLVVPLITSIAGVSGLSGGAATGGAGQGGNWDDGFDEDFDSDNFGSEVMAGGDIGTPFDNDESVFHVASEKPKSNPPTTTTTTAVLAVEAKDDVDVRFSSSIKADPQRDETTTEKEVTSTASPTTVTAQSSTVSSEVIESPTTVKSSTTTSQPATTTEFEELTFDDLLNSTDDGLQSDSLVTTTSEKNDFADFSNEIN